MAGTPEYLLLLIGALLLLGILATKLSPHLGVPALALFMAAGMLAGPEGPGGIAFHDASLARLIGTISLIGILFSSGMAARWETVSPVLRPSILLGIFSPIIATALVAVAVHQTAALPWATAALLGSVVASTDPIALGSIFRSRRARADTRLMELLRFEAAVGAAVSAFLALALFRWASGQQSEWWDVVLGFILSASVGSVMGLALGFSTVWVLNHLKPDAEVLYTLLTVAAGFLIYGITSVLAGSGFLAVFVGAVVIGNSDLPDRGPMRRFHEGMPWISQIALFVLLGLLVPPSALVTSLKTGLVVTFTLILLARPLAVLLTLPRSGFDNAQKVFASWVGLKGAVPVALATFPLYYNLPQADWILGVVAVVVVVSALTQGVTVAAFAGILKVRPIVPVEDREPLDMVDLGAGALACYSIDEQSPAAGRAISDLGLPDNCLLILVTRQGRRLRPRGSTVLNAGDEVYAYSPRELFPVLEIRLLGERRV
jgi:cell volume regulation protein A